MREYSQNLKSSIADSQEEGSAGKEMGEVLPVRNAYRIEQWRQIIQDCQKTGGVDNGKYGEYPTEFHTDFPVQ